MFGKKISDFIRSLFNLPLFYAIVVIRIPYKFHGTDSPGAREISGARSWTNTRRMWRPGEVSGSPILMIFNESWYREIMGNHPLLWPKKIRWVKYDNWPRWMLLFVLAGTREIFDIDIDRLCWHHPLLCSFATGGSRDEVREENQCVGHGTGPTHQKEGNAALRCRKQWDVNRGEVRQSFVNALRTRSSFLLPRNPHGALLITKRMDKITIFIFGDLRNLSSLK